jgi:hypothetical protein
MPSLAKQLLRHFTGIVYDRRPWGKRLRGRRASTNGGIRWTRRWVNVSHIHAALPVGLEPLTSGTWNVFFGPVHLGWMNAIIGSRSPRPHSPRTPPVTIR